MEKKGRVFAYCRVSKNDDTMTIENQEYAINKWAEEHNITLAMCFKDKCKGDTPVEKRAQLPMLLKELKDGDTVVVFEVFRLYRGFAGLQQLYKKIVEDKKAEFVTLDPKEQILCTAYGNNDDLMQQSLKSMVLLFMALFSELEKRNISRRTKNALAERKAKAKEQGIDFKLGRPEIKIPDNFKELFQQAAENKRTHTSVMKELGITKSSYYKWAEKLGLETNKRITPYMKKKEG